LGFHIFLLRSLFLLSVIRRCLFFSTFLRFFLILGSFLGWFPLGRFLLLFVLIAVSLAMVIVMFDGIAWLKRRIGTRNGDGNARDEPVETSLDLSVKSTAV
jgi:hypothetical protein